MSMPVVVVGCNCIDRRIACAWPCDDVDSIVHRIVVVVVGSCRTACVVGCRNAIDVVDSRV